MTDLTKKIYLTMDVDWACDDVLEDALNLFNAFDLPVTVFVTHPTKLIDRMRKNPLVRLGIHPNFLPLLQNQGGKDYAGVIREMMQLVPEAVSARSHGLVDATAILQTLYEFGITRDLNLFIPYSSGLIMKPFTHFSGMLRLPYFFEDDAQCLEPKKHTAEEHLFNTKDGLKIFNFHPIHLFLNSEKIERYQQAKPYQQDVQALQPFVNTDRERGTRVFLGHIERVARANGLEFGHVEDL